MSLFIFALCSLSFFSWSLLASAHSQMTEPESTAPMTCRLGGEFFYEKCKGPCDLRAIKGGYANYGSSSNPAAIYSRGQVVNIKYSRNNHGPGGFNRMTLVPVKDMMNKAIHTQNAFFYSCWGANLVIAKGNELKIRKHGYSFVGNDGEEHRFAKAYYSTKIKIPQCVPDGDYVLGWTWFGGTGTPVKSNKALKPWPYGYFSDYWSCSFVKIQGGGPVKEKCFATFKNDMKAFSNEGCMAANDSPGICTYEPCKKMGTYQKPKVFKNGKVPVLYSSFYGGKKDGNGGGSGPSKPKDKIKGLRSACMCISASQNCKWKLSRFTGGYCRPGLIAKFQPASCKMSCCIFCKYNKNFRPCRTSNAVRKTALRIC